MWKKLLLVLFFVENCLGSPEEEDRIVGGSSLSIEFRKYQVAVLPGDFVCGGALIKLDCVLTAAHCVNNFAPNEITVRAGSNFAQSGGQIQLVTKKIVHPNYVTSSTGYDISLLKLREEFTESSYIGVINLVSTMPDVGSPIIVSGYGLLSEDAAFRRVYLQSVNVAILSTSKCNTSYQGLITDTMFCAGVIGGGKDACQGDSGGPATFNDELVGIISFGKGCAEEYYPGVYTKITAFVDWINKKLTGLGSAKVFTLCFSEAVNVVKFVLEVA
ncbi:trypsin-3-like [Condylostylus longicornis]|uniref:trypsin-3-like n=1 Tax=Condylostylus longicornis TaxID=2530218 RepID=UPI00244E16AB|nr:trypsin-3-like [Condylostylus longicornis]